MCIGNCSGELELGDKLLDCVGKGYGGMVHIIMLTSSKKAIHSLTNLSKRLYL